MNIASILMDLAVVLIVIWQVRRGYHNGLMRMLIECLSWHGSRCTGCDDQLCHLRYHL